MSLVVNEDSKIQDNVIDEPTTTKNASVFGDCIAFDNTNNLLITTYSRQSNGDIVVFKKDSNDNWVYKTDINAGYTSGGPKSLSLSGNYLAVGRSSNEAGVVKIFETTDNGDSWSEKITIDPGAQHSGTYGGAEFGCQAMLEGNTLMATARMEGNNTGAVYFYSTSDNWSTVTLVNKFNGVGQERLGFSAALSGDYAIVRDWHLGCISYKKAANGSWSKKQSFNHPGDVNDYNHGGPETNSISINGNYALIGANSNTASTLGGMFRGQAFMYKTENNGTSWILKQTFILPEADRNDWDYFGKEVHLATYNNIEYAFISAENYDYDYTNDIRNTGLVNIYKKDNTGETWNLITQLMPTNNEANYNLGKSIDVDGRVLAASGANDIVFYEYIVWEIVTGVDLTVNGTDITIDYDDAGSGSIYKIERSDDNGATYTELTNNHSTNSYTDTGLNPGTLYHYKVHLSQDSGATFVVANAIGSAFIVPPLTAPTLTATQGSLNETTISLVWVGSGNNFDIQRKEGSGSFTDLTGAQDLTVKQYDNTGLTYGTEYQYKVRAKQIDISFIVPEISNKLNWTDIPNKIATNYTIESSADDFTTATTVATGHAAPPYTLSSTPASGTKFRISTTIINNPSDYSTAVSITPSDGEVQNVVFTNSASTSVSIRFDTVPNTTGYKIERKRVDVTEAYTIKSTINDNNTTTYSDTGLSPGALYFYRLRSRKNSSEDNTQRTKKAFVSKFTKPAFTSTSFGNKKTILNWGGVGANKYILKRSSDGGNTYSDIATNITGTTYTDSGLTNNSNYKYKLVASEKTFEIPATYDSNTTKATWNVEDLTILGKFTLIKKETNENSFSVIKENISESAKETTVDAAHQSATAEYKIRFNYSVDSPESDQTADITPRHPATGNTDFGADGISKIDITATSVVVEFNNNVQSGLSDGNTLNVNDFEIKNGNTTLNSSSASITDNKIIFQLASPLNSTNAADTITLSYTKNPSQDNNIYDVINNTFLGDLVSGTKAVTNVIPPGKVTITSVVGKNRRSIINWNSVPGASHYRIQVKKGSGGYEDISGNIPGNNTNFTVNNLKNNFKYKFRIKAVKSGISNGEGEISNESNETDVKASLGFVDLKSSLSASKQTDLNNTIESLSVNTAGSVRKEFEDNKASLIDGNNNVNFADVPRVKEAFKSILSSFDEIADETERKKKIRLARTEAIQMIFDLDDDILTYETEAEDLGLEEGSVQIQKIKLILPKGKDSNTITLDVVDFKNSSEYNLNNYYIPLADKQGAILKFDNDLLLVEKIIENNVDKTRLTVLNGTITATDVTSANSDFSISDVNKNYLLSDDKITLNGVSFIVGSMVVVAQPEPEVIYIPHQPGRKKHKPKAKGFFEYPGSVKNKLFMSGNFGSSGLANRKVDTLYKNKTKHTDFKLGETPVGGKPYKNWSQPVRPNIGSTDRLLRLKASAIKKSN
jgi:hypothetical protein